MPRAHGRHGHGPRNHLAETQAITTGSRRKKGERVDYWADRLALVEAEMLRVGARS